MTEDDVDAALPYQHRHPYQHRQLPPPVLPEHEVRSALLELLAARETVTATEAAGQLGYSSGLCSFHLRQLARYGHIEEVPRTGGRARPWRLRGAAPPPAAEPLVAGFGDLARGLEDESYQRWLSQRDQAPEAWRQDEAFSAVAFLTPAELTAVAQEIRATLTRYLAREAQPGNRPPDARPVALVTRLFPLLPGDPPADSE